MSVHIQAHEADIFATPARAIVNPVNCVGVMGAGLAAAFKRRYPSTFEAYEAQCAAGLLRPGGVFAHAPVEQPGLVILNFATKDHWRAPSRMEWIETGATALLACARQQGIDSIACPAIGAGLGGLEWSHVQDVLRRTFDAAPDVALLLHPPHPQPWPRLKR